MTSTTIVVGSLDALRDLVDDAATIELTREHDVVVVPTAAAFTGASAAAEDVASVFESCGALVEVVALLDRASAADGHVVDRLSRADVVVLTDGSPLHAKSVWRDTLTGDAIRDAPTLIAVGACASALFDVMIDPRGGAPTVGLGYRVGVAVTTSASEDQLERTRTLLGDATTLVVLGAHGVLVGDGTTWRVNGRDEVVTRGRVAVEL